LMTLSSVLNTYILIISLSILLVLIAVKMRQSILTLLHNTNYLQGTAAWVSCPT
jgi:hypothetical protein